MATRRTSARISNEGVSSEATTSAVTLNGKRAAGNDGASTSKTKKAKGKAPAPIPPPPPSVRKIARRRDSTKQMRVRDQSDSPPLFPVKRSRAPTEGLDGGSLEMELGRERGEWDTKVITQCILTTRALTNQGKGDTTSQATSQNRLSQLQANEAATTVSPQTSLSTSIVFFIFITDATTRRHGRSSFDRYTDDSKESRNA